MEFVPEILGLAKCTGLALGGLVVGLAAVGVALGLRPAAAVPAEGAIEWPHEGRSPSRHRWIID